jgi:hypothetical protein
VRCLATCLNNLSFEDNLYQITVFEEMQVERKRKRKDRNDGIEDFVFNAKHYADASTFFDGCSQLKSTCLKHMNEYQDLEKYLAKGVAMMSSRNSTEPEPLPCFGSPTLGECSDMLSLCQIDVGRFRLIYFPEEVVSRDICADGRFGTAQFRQRENNGIPMTATVENITFDPYIPSSSTY